MTIFFFSLDLSVAGDLVDYFLPQSFSLVFHITISISIAPCLNESPVLTFILFHFLCILPGALNLYLILDPSPLSVINLLM